MLLDNKGLNDILDNEGQIDIVGVRGWTESNPRTSEHEFILRWIFSEVVKLEIDNQNEP